MNFVIPDLNPTDGHIINGVKLDDHRFLGRIKIIQLRQISPDPRDTEDKKKLAADKSVQDARDLRDDVQRLFEGAKAKNVDPYAEYILGLHEGEDGITPAIILYSQKPLAMVFDDKSGFASIHIPWDQRLTAIDGETQLAARYEAAQRNESTAHDYVAVYICHGFDKSWARQAFHDLNVLAVRPNAAIGIGMDARDPLTTVARDVERKVPFFKDRVNTSRRQLRSSDNDVTTIAALRAACTTFSEGISGVKYGAKPVPLNDDRQKTVSEGAVQWFRALAEAIGPAMEDRENKLASAPSVMAAIGAVGHQALVHDDPAKRAAEIAKLMLKLKQVDWSRGKHWEGIAGKFTPKGAFSIGGAKETAYAIFDALNDESSSSFAKVRKQTVEAA